jgi:glutamate/tyrosine decarboxylase-like PLP-dependent enzyme
MSAALPPALPEQGLPDEVILGTLAALRQLDVPTKGGRTTSYVYDSGIDELEEFGLRAFALSQHVNGLDPTAFPSFAAVENDLVAAGLSLLGSGDPAEVGTLTSGGTESCALAVLAAREHWRASTGDPHGRPTLVAPSSVHPAFIKACHLFDVDLVAVPVDPATYAADVAAMADAIDERTALVVVSAPSYAQGVVDPVEQVAAVAAERGVLCHVDACIGGWTLPFIRQAEGLAPIGLMVPGVTSVSVDLHKYAYTPKGASLLLERDAELRHRHWFATAAWNGYPVVNPTLLSTRGGGAPAIAWAYLHKVGREGYRELALSAWRATQGILAGIDRIPGIHVVGEPGSTMFSFTDDGGADDPDVRVIIDEMTTRGWLLGAQPGHGAPPTAHMCVMAVHEPQVEQFLADLAASVDAARALGRVEVDPNLLALAASIDPATLPPEAIGMVLAAAGISPDGDSLPERRATLNAIIDAAPEALVERLLIEVLGGVLRPSPQEPTGGRA